VSFALVVAVWLDLSPPLAGGDKGEGEILSNRNDYNFSPPPQSSPVEGEEVIRLSNKRIALKKLSY
jgi:hypothetical protein